MVRGLIDHGRRPRRIARVVLLLPITIVSVLACSQTTRYQILTTLFDGVPPPGGWPEKVVDVGGTAGPDTSSLRLNRVTIHHHKPYLDRQCRECHVQFGGRLVRSPEEGLCTGCHDDLTKGARYIHGPVAARACRQCHEPHQSTIPHLLVAESTELCLRCHLQADLDPTAHPAPTALTGNLIELPLTDAPWRMGPEEQPFADKSCVDCHDPHASNFWFFLRREEGPRSP